MQDLKKIILSRLKQMDKEAHEGGRPKPFKAGYSGPDLSYSVYWLAQQLETEGLCSTYTVMRWFRESPFKASALSIQFMLALLGLKVIVKEK